MDPEQSSLVHSEQHLEWKEVYKQANFCFRKSTYFIQKKTPDITWSETKWVEINHSVQSTLLGSDYVWLKKLNDKKN